MNRALVSVLLVLLVAAPAAAQDAEGAKRTSALAARGYDASLCGTQHFGFYFEHRSIGTVVFRVEKAPPKSGAVYKVTTTMRIKVGGQASSTTEVLHLDAALALVSFDQTEAAGKPPVTKKTTIKRAGKKWVRVVRRQGVTRLHEVVRGDRDHWHSVLPFLRTVPLGSPRALVVRGVEWPSWKQSAGAGSGAGRYVDVRITIPKAGLHPHRGRLVQAHAIQVKRGERDAQTFVLDAKNRVLEIRPRGSPIRIVAGTADQVTKPLPKVQGPLDVVKVYFEVLAKVKAVAALDAVVDWKALAKQTGETEAQMKAKLTNTPAKLRKELLPQLDGILKVKRQGDTARVVIAGTKKSFAVRRGPRGWRITRLPQ